MTNRDAHTLEQAEAKRLRFDRYVLDLHRGCLHVDGNEIALRPKTFAVLRHLVENSGRLVSKDDLFAAVWPNAAVTDDALVQSIGELRRALGDDGSRLIRTIPRRGYRFEASVSAVAPVAPTVADAAQEEASLAGAHVPKAPVWLRASTLLGMPLHDWRARALTILALVVAVMAGVLWVSRSPPRPSNVWTNGADAGAKPAIAILPLVNQSDDPTRDYFADGLTQDIINALGRFPALTVMSWNAVAPYRGKPARPGEIANSLSVRYQVEGGVQQSGGRVRVIAQLVNADGRVLWSGRFDEALEDVFALQNKITTQIAGALAIRVTQFEQQLASVKPTKSLEAYDYVLRARPALQRPARANNVEARALLRRAIQLDPNYAAAYAALAETYHIDVSMGWAQSPTVALKRAEEMASKALSLDDSDVLARVVLGRIHIFYQRHAQARSEMDRAIAINPSDAHGLAGRGNILMWSGQTDAAIEVLELAQRIDPELNAIDRFALSLAYYLKRRYVAASEQAELDIRKTEDAHFSHAVLAAAYAQQGRSEDAARVSAKVRRIDPTFDPQAFGSKFLNPADLDHLRDGFRKAGLYGAEARPMPPAK
jgi:TolB-like protein/DNA-binding winged helix-turn-helix (wHTH) protein/cytochrome c-type biogenesis protein CcmH/NrfG